jgi:pyridoxal phosphate enzyme, YggS family
MKENQSNFNFDEKLIKNNFEIIREQIDKADHEVTLLAATKTMPPDVINYAVNELGIRDIGENRVQELLDKYSLIDKDNLNIHFIGSLQTNKVKYIIDKVSMIHSLDSYRLAEEIEKQAAKINRVIDVLVEVNIGEEPNKSGFMPDIGEIAEFVASLAGFSHLNVRGLMTMAPICQNNTDYVKYFKKTYKIFIDIFIKKFHNIDIPILSMGMSDSYIPAIECGSNMIRVGTALFGKRN